MDPLTGARVGHFVFKKFKAWRVRRRGKAMALETGLRTSTNTVVGTGLFGSFAVQLIKLLPYPELVAALTTPEAVILWGSAIAWGVARLSKTPTDPGKL